MATESTLLTDEWQEVASGPATLTISTDSTDARWIIDAPSETPSFSGGHYVPFRGNESMVLAAGEALYARGGVGSLFYTEGEV